MVLVTGLVEKPPVDEAPSNLAVIGRYLLDPSVFDVLRQTEPGRGGEIQLTDALQHARRRRRWPAPACAGWSSAAAATTPATGWSTSRRSSGWPASIPSWVRSSVRGWAVSPASEAQGGRRVIPVEEHVRRILDAVQPLPPSDIPSTQAQDCVLAEDVVSPLDLPGVRQLGDGRLRGHGRGRRRGHGERARRRCRSSATCRPAAPTGPAWCRARRSGS